MNRHRSDEAPRIKVCGITRYEDARVAVDLGAWAFGLNFYPRSPRYVQPESAREIVEKFPAEVLSVGVFVDSPEEEVRRIAGFVGLRGIQLHGNEPPEALDWVRPELVIKAFRVGPGFAPAETAPYGNCLILLDTYRPGVPGGTGETFDWSAAGEIARRRDVILEGGIGPNNAMEALRSVRPFALDVSSGVESSPGIKDPKRLRQLFKEIDSFRG